MRTNITKTSMELIRNKKKFFVINTPVPFSFTDLTNRCKALHMIFNRSGVETFWGLWTSSWNFIYAQKDVQKPNFVMPELLINELWLGKPWARNTNRSLGFSRKKIYIYFFLNINILIEAIMLVFSRCFFLFFIFFYLWFFSEHIQTWVL